MKNTLVLIAILIIVSNVQAQKHYNVSGKVTDESGIPLPGVNVIVEGTLKGTVTDFNGNYNIAVDNENKTLGFYFIGYKDKKVVVDRDGIYNVVMISDMKLLNEVVISTQAKGQRGAILEQIKSNTIKNVVAADRLQENPDANSVEALGRLPGISVLRSGGEGSHLVIRGLQPQYASVTMNGVKLPATGSTSRETNISGISQYALQGAEVFKSLTADMEGDAVAGTINLKTRKAPENQQFNVMLQGGYNNMNNYFGNYKFAGDYSNRFFNNKLGLVVSLNAEQVNRSTETMSAGYGNESSDLNILITNTGLNLFERFNNRKSGMFSLDYKVHPSTNLSLFTIYSTSKSDIKSQSKNYGASGSGILSYSDAYIPNNSKNILQVTFSGLTKLDGLNLEIDYGAAYSQSEANNLGARSWNWGYLTVPTNTVFDVAYRETASPSDVVNSYYDNPDNLDNLILKTIGEANDNMVDENLTAYLNFEMTYSIGTLITGSLKTGGMYRNKSRIRDKNAGGMDIANNQFAKPVIANSLDWIKLSGINNQITAINMTENRVDDFLDGQYDYGYLFNWDKLNQISDVWSQYSEDLYAQGEDVWKKIISQDKLGYSHEVPGSMLSDQDITEQYFAGYLMGEINVGKWLMFLPGIRYENNSATMKGFSAIQPSQSPPVYDPLDGSETSAERSDEFWLPMIHMRIKPHSNYYIHTSYTKTISRPGFDQISPNTWLNVGLPPFAYITQNPKLRTEEWESFDAQFTFYKNKIGLMSVNGFYKKVENKIWHRSYQRLPGDPIIEPFPDGSLVNVQAPENHPYDVNVKGVEVEVQTSLWYLPKPFKYFTASVNYTYTKSETKYPLSWVENQVPPEGGRPVAVRIDSTAKGPMLFQPEHILNTSLGFNRKGLNVWLSYQYNGKIFTGKNYWDDELDNMKLAFNRWDLQVTQKLTGKFQGFELIGNIANLSNFTEVQQLRGDERPTYGESYGWTMDLGVRFRY